MGGSGIAAGRRALRAVTESGLVSRQGGWRVAGISNMFSYSCSRCRPSRRPQDAMPWTSAFPRDWVIGVNGRAGAACGDGA